MEIVYEKSFEKDLKRISDKRVREQVKLKIVEIRNCNKLTEIKNVKKLTGHNAIYRIRISDYRIGFEFAESKLIFTRILHRKDIYKYYP
ncbi:MAG TPA: type II toxin-antitoxin system RelE/ParE family toxin [Ignavibacteria bacterium]|nr:type II toxin-antitoxin system RelE/ParE family toxin [Ignavibacteria bacterium]